jgi:hypothetical protein
LRKLLRVEGQVLRAGGRLQHRLRWRCPRIGWTGTGKGRRAQPKQRTWGRQPWRPVWRAGWEVDADTLADLICAETRKQPWWDAG